MFCSWLSCWRAVNLSELGTNSCLGGGGDLGMEYLRSCGHSANRTSNDFTMRSPYTLASLTVGDKLL